MTIETRTSRRRRAGGTGRGVGPAALCALLLAGCAALLPQTPRAIYDLTAPSDVPGSGRVGGQILIAPPSAVRALNSDLIAARPSNAEYAYLPGAQWSDVLPKLLQARLLETFQNSGRVAAVGLPGQGLLIDYQVILDIRAFELRGDVAVVEFAVKLMNDRNGRIVATTIVGASAPVAGETAQAVVQGLDAATDEAFVRIVDWVAGRA